MSWNITQETGYIPVTTFWDDFGIADKFGLSAIEDTYKRSFKEWKTNVKYITELVMVLNHRCWLHYYIKNIEMSKLYERLYYELDEWCMNNLKGEDLDYYISVTD